LPGCPRFPQGLAGLWESVLIVLELSWRRHAGVMVIPAIRCPTFNFPLKLIFY